MNVSTLHIGPRGRLSPYQHLCLYSFARKGYSVNIYTYNQDLHLPTFVAHRDASEILPEEAIFENVREGGSFSMFSNIFRYHLLSKVSTTWIDTDVILLADKLPEGEFLYGFQDDRHTTINGAILKVPCQSPLLAASIDGCRGAPETLHWGQWGPKLLTCLVREMGLTKESQSYSVLYPIGWPDALAPFAANLRKEIVSSTRGSATLHLWNEILRRYLPSYPLCAPSSGSFLAELVDKWGLRSLFGPPLTEENLREAESALSAAHPRAISRMRLFNRQNATPYPQRNSEARL